MPDGRPVPATGGLVLCGLLCLLASHLSRAGGEPGFDVLHVNERYAQPVDVLAAEADVGAGWVRYVLHGPSGIFAVDLDPIPPELRRMTLILTGLSRLESVSLTTPDGDYLELHALRIPPPDGVVVAAREDGFEIRFTGPAMELLAPGGRLQVVDAWR